MRWIFRRKGKDQETEEQEQEQEEIREQSQKGLQKTRDTWFSRVAGMFREAQISDELWDELEEALVSSDVGMATASELMERVRDRVADERRGDAASVLAYLKEEMVWMLEDAFPEEEESSGPEPRPTVVLMVGVNGAGKTTSIAKLAYRAKRDGKRVVLGAADTFRAAAVEQLQAWGKRLGVEVIAHQAGGDPGAVAHDTVLAARSRDADIAIIDTAGRLHTKSNLMEELKKVQRVINRLDPTAPHQVLLVLDATTGQNGLVQAKYFTEAVGCSGVVLAKLDGTAKGGIVLAIAHELELPVLWVGTGEHMEDLTPFDPQLFVDALFASEPQGATSR